MMARRTAFAGGVEARRDQQVLAGPCRFVRSLPPKLAHAHVAQGARQMPVLDHALHIQVFQHDHGWPLSVGLGSRHDPSGGLVQRIAAYVGHACMETRHPATRLVTIAPALLTPGQRPLGASQRLLRLVQRFGIGEGAAIRTRRQRPDPQVDAQRRASSRRWIRCLYGHLHRHKPPPCALGNRGAKNVCANRQIVRSFNRSLPKRGSWI